MDNRHFDPATPGAARALLREIGAAPNRTLGQNFLVNGALLDRIVQESGIASTDAVLEIGPGLGALTCRLVRATARVTAIEKDAPLAALLARHLTASNLKLVTADALRVEWNDLDLPPTGVHVVANLPYSISKPMLRRIFEEWRPHLHSATVMVQREVADRLVAAAATNAYGPMAIMAQLYGAATLLFDVQPGSFLPPPDVTSSVVRIVLSQKPALDLSDEPFFWRVVRAAFAQRRKQLGNTLRAVVPDKNVLLAALRELDIDPQRRGETLSLEEYGRLTDRLKESS